MKFFIVSERGDFFGAALRLIKEGNDAFIWLKEPRSRKAMQNLIPQVKSVSDGLLRAPDVIVFDMVGMGKQADELKRKGWKVVGGGSFHDQLELDRPYGFKVMETFGIRTPKTFAFPNFSDAAKFILSHSKKLVFKPNLNLQTNYTYVGKSNDDVLNFVSHLKRVRGVDGPCVLQEYIHGTEISTEIWYSQGEPLAVPNSTIEVKKFMPGDLGVSTGSMASIVFPYPTREPRTVQMSLKKIKILLEKKGYTGALDINGIVSKGRFYGIEFSSRFGYNALYAFLPLLQMDLGAVLLNLANGDRRPLDLLQEFGCALRCSIPPYPFESDDPKINEAVYHPTRDLYVGGVEKDAWGTSIFPLDVYAKKDGICTAGFDGITAEVTGHGPSVYEAYEQAEERFKKIELPGKQARLKDIVRVAERRLSELAMMNYDVPQLYPMVAVESVAHEKPIEPKKEGHHERKETPVGPRHMARTTLSMPHKYS